MARDYGRIKVSIWSDPDFIRLPIDAQHMYFMLLSQPRLSYCGVLDYLPGRLATMCPDHDDVTANMAVKLLEADRFVVVDRGTSELLVRSFIRHDQLLTSPNVTKAMVRDYTSVLSPDLQEVIVEELQRCFRDDPKQNGWKGLKEASATLYATVTGRALPKGSVKGS